MSPDRHQNLSTFFGSPTLPENLISDLAYTVTGICKESSVCLYIKWDALCM